MGFPQYAARCVGRFVKSTSEPVMVIADRPTVPIKGMETLCNCDLIWIEKDEKKSLVELCKGQMPRVLIVSGWHNPNFNNYREDVRKSGGRVIAMVDHNFKLLNNKRLCFEFLKVFLIEMMKSIRFRLFFRNKFDAFFVPGESGLKLMRFYGVPKHKIVQGLYAADSELFKMRGFELDIKKRKIIYVGQFIERKNVLNMINAFYLAASKLKISCSLDLYGSGVLQEELEKRAALLNHELSAYESRIGVHSFLQPEELAKLYSQSYAFCLPSYDEHWGLVVHEAALSGCVLLLSEAIGSRFDFLVQDGKGNKYANGATFDPYDVRSISKAFEKILLMSDDAILLAQNVSLEAAGKFSVVNFTQSLLKIVGKN
jgi:glycosyltransferase involved in cell wall biosynthesis